MKSKKWRNFVMMFILGVISVIVLSFQVKADESGLIEKSLEDDQAYLSEFAITKIIDGTESFDTSEDPESPYYRDRIGNDENGSNKKVRTFDEITYNLRYQTSVYGEKYFEKGAIQFEFVLPLKETETVWDTTAMSWMDYGWKIVTEERTYDFNRDGVKETVSCQVLKGKKTLNKTATNPTAVPGNGTLMAAVKVRAMRNDDIVSPVLTAWMEHNKSGDTELEQSSMNPTDADIICKEHLRREQLTIQADDVAVTAQPRYNIQLKQGVDSYNQVIGGTYDFNEGNEKALDQGIGKITGTTTAYGVTVQLYNDKGKDLKGIELPDGPITFNLELATAFVPANTKLTESQKEYVAQNYAPVVLSWGAAANAGKMDDGRSVGENTTYVVRGAPGNFSKSWGKNGNINCHNGGSWSAVKEDNTISITIEDYEIDIDKFPNTDLGYSSVTNTYFDPEKGVENVGCFSAGMFYILTPSYNNGKTDPERKNLQILKDLQVEDGTFYTTIKDAKLRARSISGQQLMAVEDSSNQTGPQIDVANKKYGDDSITSTVYLSRPGNRTYRNQYSMADGHGGETEADPLGQRYGQGKSNWGNGKDALLRGQNCAIMNGLRNIENGDVNNRVYAANVLAKFDADAIKLTGRSSVGTGVTKAGFRASVLYAAKADGTNWKNDEEMQCAKMEELRYFATLEELETDGYRCVGFMAEYRPLGEDYTKIKKVQEGAILYAQAEGRVSMSAVPGKVYQTIVAAKGWCGRDYIQTLEHSGIPSMLENDPSAGVDNGVELPDATYTAYREYEKARYNEYGFVGGHTGSYNYGDSLYVLETQTSIRKDVEQMENGRRKSIYHVSDGQRYVDYVLTPKWENSMENGETSSTESQDAATNIMITDILPEKLFYIPGSAYIGGTYMQNEESGQTGTVIGGTSSEPEVRKNADGTATLVWRLRNVDSNVSLPQIHYSVLIGTPGDSEQDVQNNDDILNIARIKSDGDLREYSEVAENEANVGIRVSKLERSSPSKIPDQRFHDVSDAVGYTINVGNNGGDDLKNQLIMDIMPMNGDDRGNNFHGIIRIEELKINPDKLGNMESWECYYTESPSVKDTGAKDYNYEDIIKEKCTNMNGEIIEWKRAEIKPDGEITAITGKSPTAIVWIGNLTGEKTLSAYCRLKVEGARGGDVIVNGISHGKDETAKPKVYFVDRKISGLAWIDQNENGQREPEEDILSGVNVYLLRKNDKGIYENVLDTEGKIIYLETKKNPDERQEVQTFLVKGKNGIDEEADYEVRAVAEPDGKYVFENLPSGEYGIDFKSGSGTLEKFLPTKENVGDDVTDSDGSEIRKIVLPVAKDMLVSHYESLYNDAGFYLKKGKITIKKTDSKGKKLKGAVFEIEKKAENGEWEKVTEERSTKENTIEKIEMKIVTDEQGTAVAEGLQYGTYRIIEKSTMKENQLLKEPIEVAIPYVSNQKEEKEPSYTENGKYYYLELTYQIKNDKIFALPASGGKGKKIWILSGMILAMIGILGMKSVYTKTRIEEKKSNNYCEK